MKTREPYPYELNQPGLDEIDLKAASEGKAIKNRGSSKKSHKTPKEEILPQGKVYDELAHRNVIHGKVKHVT